MENASKALIIAGAILISILLIAISMYIYNSAQGTINNAGSKMSENEKQIYNSTVLSYLGDNKKGIDVKSLIDAIITSNNNCAGDSGKFIAIETSGFSSSESGISNATLGEPGDPDNNESKVNDVSNNMSKLKSHVNMGKRYTIDPTYSTGLVTKVKITEKN